MKKYYIFIWTIFFLICSTSVVYFLGLWKLTDIAKLSSPDSYSYLNCATKIATNFEPDALRTYGYPFLILFFKTITNSNASFLLIMYFFQVICLYISYLILYKIISVYSKPVFALFVIIVLCCNPSFIVYCFLIHTEIVFIFLVSLTAYFFHLFIQSSKSTFLLFSLFSCSIATLVRPGLYYFTLLFFILLLFYFLRFSIYKAVIACLILISTIGVQVYQMHAYFGHYKITFIDDVANYRYLNNAVLINSEIPNVSDVLNKRNLFFDTLVYNKSKQNWHLVHRMARQDTKYLISKNPYLYVNTFLLNLKDSYSTGNFFLRDLPTEVIRNSDIQKKLIFITKLYNTLFFYILMLTTLLFLFALVLKKYKKTIGILILLFISISFYTFFTSGISLGEGDRFNIVWHPFCLVAMVLVLVMIIDNWINKYSKLAIK